VLLNNNNAIHLIQIYNSRNLIVLLNSSRNSMSDNKSTTVEI